MTDCTSTNREERPPLCEADFDAVLAYLPVFEAEGFQAGRWDEGEPPRMGMWLYCDDVELFYKALYDHHWVALGFDWMTWVNEIGSETVQSFDYIAAADLETLRSLLTAHVRNDRFCDGHLAHVFQTGQMVAILHRIRSLKEAA